MPYASHVRITASGTIGGNVLGDGAQEAFSFGFALAGASTTPLVNGETTNAGLWEDIAQDVATFFGDGATKICNGARLRQVKFASIGADGKYLFDPYISEMSIPGASVDALTHPPQISLAVSLETARRGPSGRGRFFLPCPALGVGVLDLLVPESQMAGVPESVQTLINAVNNQPGLDQDQAVVCVASTKGYNTPVTGVRVGRVLDTVRSRRRSIGEAYGATLPVA